MKDQHWQARVHGTRIGVSKALRDIKAGAVDEEDFEKLSNFCMFALALMQAEGPVRWSRAKLNAELMSYIKDEL